MSKYSSTAISFITMTTQLGEVLSSTSIIKNYKNTQVKLNVDAKAMNLLSKFSAARKELGAKQFSGAITQDILNDYHEIQNEVEKNQTIIEYSQAQQEAIQFLRNVNLEISQLIGIDFSLLIKRKNIC